MDYIRWRIVGVMFLPSIFENRCGDFRRSMYRLSKIDVTMCRPSKIDDRWSMCRSSKIDGRCEIRLLYLLKTLILYVSCMRITPRVCTSVLSLTLGAHAHSEGYSSCRVCMYVCMCVCVCVCV